MNGYDEVTIAQKKSPYTASNWPLVLVFSASNEIRVIITGYDYCGISADAKSR